MISICWGQGVLALPAGMQPDAHAENFGIVIVIDRLGESGQLSLLFGHYRAADISG